jgi:hypothetical protein
VTPGGDWSGRLETGGGAPVAPGTRHEEANVGTGSERVTGTVREDDEYMIGSRLPIEQAWQELANGSFAVRSVPDVAPDDVEV